MKPGGTLVVVESPAKGKTIQRWLGPGHTVMATLGHLLDLPEHALGVDVERGFQPRYEVLKGKNRLLSDLKRAARGAAQVLLATDPDREGEAIAWLLAAELGAPGGDGRIRRVILNELTPEAIRAAVARPRDLDRRRFEAQQARRILDRLVGWQVSPLLWARVRRGLSAGRVQSVAVRLVVEREREREAFVPVARWGVEADLAPPRGPALRARLVSLAGRPVPLRGQAEAEALVATLGEAAFEVEEVARRPVATPAPPAFTTAALQRAAAAELGLSPRRTMALAQRLYEGIELGEEGAIGLISYARTDSTHVSAAAAAWGRAWAEEAYGAAGPGPGPGPGAASAHEAIRPTSAAWPPERVLPVLAKARERDLGRLYRLVWERFIASLLGPALHEVVTARLVARPPGPGRPEAPAIFEAAGATLASPGWLLAHGDHPPSPESGGPVAAALPRLPRLEPGQRLGLEALAAACEPGQPPPRFSEATLVQALESRGLGRPSTFAAIVDTVQARGYVERVEQRLAPTALGVRVTEALAEALPRELDVAFTAGLEAELDLVEAGRAEWQAVVAGFHGPLREALARAEAVRAGGPAAAGVACERCGRPMAVRLGKAGEFLACTGFPACRATRDFRREGGAIVPEPAPGSDAGQPCPRCGAPLRSRRGRFGRFLACARYPACDGKVAPSIGVPCPRGCGGEVTERRSKRGRTFFGCSTWPACDFVSWDRPRAEPCPDCGGTWLVEAISRRSGPVLACPDKDCGYRRPDVGARP